MPTETSYPSNRGRAAQERGTGEARQKTDQAQDRIKDKASEATGRAREQAEEKMSQQKERATGQLENVSSALRDTSHNLRDQQQDSIAGYVDSAAEQVDRLSSYVRNRSVGELMNDIEDVARREPALFIGGAVLLGVFGGRFLKSSQHHTGRMRSDRGSQRYRSDDYENREMTTYRTYEAEYQPKPESAW